MKKEDIVTLDDLKKSSMLGENVEVGAAFDYVDGYWEAPVFDVY